MPIDHRTHREAVVERGVTLGAFVVICEGATVHEGATIAPLAYIGPGVTVGAGAQVGPHAVVLADVPEGATVGAAEVWRGVPRKDAPEPSCEATGRAEGSGVVSDIAITAAPGMDVTAIAEAVVQRVAKRGRPRK
jgi:carbonic anhydrase/acetyltransferase-like protein (isoleucine patch superfamily)